MVATPLLTATTPPLGAPVRATPFSENVTTPRFGVGLLVTVAVKLMAVPNGASGFADEVSTVVVGCPVAGVIAKHHPEAELAAAEGPPMLLKKSFQAPCAAAPEKEVRNVAVPNG